MTASRVLTNSAPLWSSQINGVVADGADYGIFVPTNWNGDVVFYAHGIVPRLAPVSLPGPADWDNAGAGFQLIAFSKQVQLAGNDATELLTSLVNALAYQAIGVNDLLARTHGHILFDNSHTDYSSAIPAFLPDAAYGPVNAGIRRYTATPDALDWLEHNYEPTGNLQIPMLTVHKTRDRLVPFRHEDAYRGRVADAGASANLAQRSQDAFGHCHFDADYMLSNLRDLVQWVDTGVKPQ